MISYAQNREDVVLARAFAGRRKGLYIDVGAEHPTALSVTKHFYNLGWRGINIEPTPSAFAALEQERPADVNLRVGLADYVGTATLFEGPPENHGSSTFDAQLADEMAAHGYALHEIPDVPISTLAHVCKEWVGERDIDFLKIDVEGWERAVIEGADWDRWRPLVVVVEATIPNTSTPSHDDWEPRLLDAGYVCTLFDGLNRFYCRADHPELLAPLSVPANVLDDVVDFRALLTERALREQLEWHTEALADAQHNHQLVVDRVAALEEDRHARAEQLAAHLEALANAQGETRATAEQLALHVDALRLERREHHLARERLAQLEEEVAIQDIEALALRRHAADVEVRLEHAVALEREHAVALEREVAALLATKTFRWTSAPRAVYGRLRGRPR